MNDAIERAREFFQAGDWCDDTERAEVIALAALECMEALRGPEMGVDDVGNIVYLHDEARKRFKEAVGE